MMNFKVLEVFVVPKNANQSPQRHSLHFYEAEYREWSMTTLKILRILTEMVPSVLPLS